MAVVKPVKLKREILCQAASVILLKSTIVGAEIKETVDENGSVRQCYVILVHEPRYGDTHQMRIELDDADPMN